MADFSEEMFEHALNEVTCKLKIELKPQQKDAVKQLVFGGDLLAVLPTGFGKSLIFQTLVIVSTKLRKIPSQNSRVIVICPLKSIMQDQILEAESFGIPAGLLSDEEKKFHSFQLLFGSAEEVLDERFLTFLKNETSFRDSLVGLIVDESHTIESWTTEKRKAKKKQKGFREAFGKLGNLRSFLKSGTPIGAVTGTADKTTQDTIISALCLRNALKIFLSPNRPNLRFYVKKVPSPPLSLSPFSLGPIKKRLIYCKFEQF